MLFSGMRALPKKLLPLTLIGIAVTSFFSVQPAQAYRVTLKEVGSNVVANGSGPINLTGLNSDIQFLILDGTIIANIGLIITGPLGIFAHGFSGITGPTSFGSGGFSLPN